MEFVLGVLVGIILAMNYPDEIKPWYVKAYQIWKEWKDARTKRKVENTPTEKL